MNKRLIMVSALLLFSVFALSGCKKSAEEKVAEKSMENILGNQADVDVDGEDVTVETEYGTMKAGENLDLPKDWPEDVYVTDGEWTCYYEIWGEENVKKFNSLQISNNHLITSDKKIQKVIKSMRKGDQIYLRGKLVGYTESDQPENMYRMTSLVRDDNGCEIIYVEEARILKRGKEMIYTINKASKYGIYILILLNILIFIINLFKKPSYIEKE